MEVSLFVDEKKIIIKQLGIPFYCLMFELINF